jgi:DNA-binding NarL/FixJ family response regulator
VHSAHPRLATVVLLDSYDRELVVNSLRAGTRGLFCLASMPFKFLCRCITSVYQGQYYTEQMSYLIDALSIGPSIHLINSRGHVVLTPREEQTVHLVTEGLNNRDLARELNLKDNTVKKSLLRIYDKLGVSNRVELVLSALSHREERAAEPDLEQFGVLKSDFWPFQPFATAWWQYSGRRKNRSPKSAISLPVEGFAVPTQARW